jgi:hypothetical protein
VEKNAVAGAMRDPFAASSHLAGLAATEMKGLSYKEHSFMKEYAG